MANRVPLIVDTSTLFIKELPLGDGLDLTGCSLVGVTSFTRSAGHEFSGITTFSSAVVFNAGITANTAKISDLTDNRVVIAGTAGELEDSGNLTFDGSTLGLTGSQTISSNLTVTGNAVVNGNTDLGNATSDTITATGRFDSALVPSADDTYDLGASDREWKDLYVDGVANIDSLAVGVLTHSGLTQHRVVLAGADGTISDSSGLSYNGSTLAVTGDITASGNLNYQTVTDIRSVGIITASKGVQIEADGLNVEAGIATFAAAIDANGAVDIAGDVDIDDETQSTTTTTGALKVDGGVGIVKNLVVGGITKLSTGLDVSSGVSTFVGLGTFGNDLWVANNFNVAGISTLTGSVIAKGDVTFTGGSANATWVGSGNALNIADGAFIDFGDNAELKIYHQHSNNHSYIKETGGGSLIVLADDFYVQDTYTNTLIKGEEGGGVGLYHTITGGTATTIRVGTTTEGADITGTGALRIPVGNSGFRPSSPAQGDIRYNTTINTFEGYDGSAWGGLGGGTEIDNVVVTTSATGIGTFVKTDYRSASVRVQITQGTDYQVGRYLMIHDGTTVTVVEEAAIATNSMLGTIDGVITGSNAVLRVTMGSASSATITTIIDKISV